MIEVQAKLLRDIVYMAGDSIECMVTFKNISDFHAKSHRNCFKHGSENLAWASAQIHCQCSVDETKVKFPQSLSQEQLATGSKDTSFIPCRGEKGYVVYSSKPKILFCDLCLMPGESKTFVYTETIPPSVPPSYRGSAVRYAYKITIGTQRVNALIKLLKIPIRVLVIKGLTDVLKEREHAMQCIPSNPFLPPVNKQSVLEVALDFLEDITARRRPNYYNVTHQNGRVVRFCLLKSCFRLGEDIIGTFDFSEATVPCVQYSVTLQSEEEIIDEASIESRPSASTLAYSKHHEFCLHLQSTHMALPVPVHVTPTFSSEIVNFKWKLHFEFVMTTTPQPDILVPSPTKELTWQGPATLEVQTMIWDLPILIYPTHPTHVSNGLLTVPEHTLVI